MGCLQEIEDFGHTCHSWSVFKTLSHPYPLLSAWNRVLKLVVGRLPPAFTLGVDGVGEGWVGAAPNGGAARGVGNDQTLTEELSHELHMGCLSTTLTGTAFSLEMVCSDMAVKRVPIFRGIAGFKEETTETSCWGMTWPTTYLEYLTYLMQMIQIVAKRLNSRCGFWNWEPFTVVLSISSPRSGRVTAKFQLASSS